MRNNNITKVISEELNKMKNLMVVKPESGKCLNESIKIVSEQSQAIRNKGEGLGRITSLLSNLNPIKNSKLPTWSNGKSIINLGTQNIENVHVKTNIGNLYFFTFKPAGYFTQNNFVLVVKDGITTIGTWDLDNMYFKKQGDTSFTDSGFDTTIRLSYLEPQQKSLDKKENVNQQKEKNVVNNNSDKNAQREKIKLQNQNISNEIQRTIGLPETGTLDTQSIQKLIDMLSDVERPKVQSVQDLIPNVGIKTSNTGEQLKQIASQQQLNIK